MKHLRLSLSTAALAHALALAAAVPAFAASSASSAVSESSSASIGSISTSIGQSSESSTGKNVAQGEYRVIEVAAADSEGAKARVTLQALADDSAAGTLVLTLPRVAAERGLLRAGAVVVASTRPYGLEFTAAATRQPFFLALHDDWFRELDSRPVTL
jgi:hypothetical protein